MPGKVVVAVLAVLVDGEAPAHSTAHVSDIISHVTLIFESSRYVDCIRSASASALQYSFLPSFRLFLHIQLLPSYLLSLSLSVSLCASQLCLPIQSTIFVGAHIVLRITYFVN